MARSARRVPVAPPPPEAVDGGGDEHRHHEEPGDHGDDVLLEQLHQRADVGHGREDVADLGHHVGQEVGVAVGVALQLEHGRPAVVRGRGLTWAYCLPSLGRERARRVREVWSRAHVPLLDPYLTLQVAIAERDVEAAKSAIGDVDPAVAPNLVRVAAEVLGVGSPEGAGHQDDEAPQRPAEPLSAREREIARLVRSGLANRQIAEHLHISVRTVENHVSRVLRKLRLSGRAELTTWTDDGPAVA